MLKKGIIIILLFLGLSNYTYGNNYVDKVVDGYRFRYIKYDTKSDEYIFKVGVNRDYNATSLRELMEENNGVSAVNGVYFCPSDYPECGGKNFTKNERYIAGDKIGATTSTQDRVVFAIDENNNSFLFQTDFINKAKEHNIYYGLANFPLLLQDGVSKYDDYEELGLVDYKMELKMQRNFICSDKTNQYIFNGYISEISLKDLPEELLKIGCYNALNLDAGSSSAMIYNGKYIIGPGRNILDGIIIEKKGFNIQESIKYANKVSKLIERKLKNKSYNYRLEFISNFVSILNQNKTNIYESHSIDLYNTETGDIIGYEISIESNNTLNILYFSNYLIKNLWELQNKYNDENKIIEDNQNLLF